LVGRPNCGADAAALFDPAAVPVIPASAQPSLP
jgi:hypothetical protein